MADSHDLRSLIIPVEEGLRKFDQLYDEMLSSMSGAFLIIRGQPGSGKSTLLQTMDLFREGVETVTITRNEPIRDALKALPPFAGTMRVVVIADREALGDITDVVRVPPDRPEHDRHLQFRRVAGEPGDLRRAHRATRRSGRDDRHLSQAAAGGNLPALTAIEVIHDYADESLGALVQDPGFQISGATDGKGRLLDSELASALQGEPVGTLRRGPKPADRDESLRDRELRPDQTGQLRSGHRIPLNAGRPGSDGAIHGDPDHSTGGGLGYAGKEKVVIERYIGIDLTDPYARKPPITVVEFVPDGANFRGRLEVQEDMRWPENYPRRTSELTGSTPLPASWPSGNPGQRVWIAIDGPQGLAGPRTATQRLCERESGDPGRTPHGYPVIGDPFAGFVTGSVVLWSQLFQFHKPPVSIDQGQAARTESGVNVCEVYPGVTWAELTPGRRMPPKNQKEGKEARISLLGQLGIEVDSEVNECRDAADILDAGLSAVVAYSWSKGIHRLYGVAPRWDDQTRSWRKGYIRSTHLRDFPGWERVDFTAVDTAIDRYRQRRKDAVTWLNRTGITPTNQPEVLERIEPMSYADVLLLCLMDNSGVWEQHNDWLVGLALTSSFWTRKARRSCSRRPGIATGNGSAIPRH